MASFSLNYSRFISIESFFASPFPNAGLSTSFAALLRLTLALFAFLFEAYLQTAVAVSSAAFAATFFVCAFPSIFVVTLPQLALK